MMNMKDDAFYLQDQSLSLRGLLDGSCNVFVQNDATY